MTHFRKTRCAIARCPHCSWVEVFFGTDRFELKLRATLEQVFHMATHKDTRHANVKHVHDSVVYRQDDEAKNDALWHAIAAQVDNSSISLFNEALVAHLAKTTRHDVWSKSVENALAALVTLIQTVDGGNGGDFNGTH